MSSKSLALILILASTIGTGCTWKKATPSDASTATSSWTEEKVAVLEMGSGGNTVALSSVGYSGSSISEENAFNGAVNSKNASNCKKLPKPEDQSACEDKILYTSAVAQLKIDLCEGISDGEIKKLCTEDVTRQTFERISSLAGCKQIKNLPLRAKCEERMGLLESPKDAASCLKLEDPALRIECSDRVAIASVRAGTVTDPKFCDSIKEPLFVRECKFRIAKLAEASEEKEVYSKQEYGEIKSACASEIGLNEDVCRKKKVLESAGKTGDSSACASIENTTVRDACIKEVAGVLAKTILDQALSSKNASLCEKISDASYAARCREIVTKNQ